MRSASKSPFVEVNSIRTSVFTLERYVTEVLMRDLIAHDHLPSAFLVYLFLRARATVQETSQQTQRRGMHPVTISVRELAAQTGLAKSVVQTALTVLRRRQLIRAVAPEKTNRKRVATSYEVLRPWRRTNRRQPRNQFRTRQNRQETPERRQRAETPGSGSATHFDRDESHVIHGTDPRIELLCLNCLPP
jgi:hypothetical protein